MVLVDKGAVARRFLHGVQVLPLEVFDHGQLGGLAVIGLDDGDGDLAEACQTGGPPAAFTGDDLVVAIGQFPYGQRLHHTVQGNGIRQRLQFLRVKVLAWLTGIWLYFMNGQHLIGTFSGGGFHRKITHQRAKTFA